MFLLCAQHDRSFFKVTKKSFFFLSCLFYMAIFLYLEILPGELHHELNIKQLNVSENLNRFISLSFTKIMNSTGMTLSYDMWFCADPKENALTIEKAIYSNGKGYWIGVKSQIRIAHMCYKCLYFLFLWPWQTSLTKHGFFSCETYIQPSLHSLWESHCQLIRNGVSVAM